MLLEIAAGAGTAKHHKINILAVLFIPSDDALNVQVINQAPPEGEIG